MFLQTATNQEEPKMQVNRWQDAAEEAAAAQMISAGEYQPTPEGKRLMRTANIKTGTMWGRRLSHGPWHILAGFAPGHWRRTQCGRVLKGELEKAYGPADGPDHDRPGSRTCPSCKQWAHQPKEL